MNLPLHELHTKDGIELRDENEKLIFILRKLVNKWRVCDTSKTWEPLLNHVEGWNSIISAVLYANALYLESNYNHGL